MGRENDTFNAPTFCLLNCEVYSKTYNIPMTLFPILMLLPINEVALNSHLLIFYQIL